MKIVYRVLLRFFFFLNNILSYMPCCLWIIGVAQPWNPWKVATPGIVSTLVGPFIATNTTPSLILPVLS